MASAIELYKQAYDLDFRHGDLDYAESLYREIIEKFPNEVEKEYAELHLERIHRLRIDPKNSTLKSHQRADGVNGLVIFNLMLTMLTLVVLGFGFWFVYEKQRDIRSLQLIIEGQICEKDKAYGSAIDKYYDASILSPNMALSHSLLAKRYLEQGEYKLANIEGEKWLFLSPNDKFAKAFSNRIAKKISE